MIHGASPTSVSDLKDRAKRLVIKHLVSAAEQDGVPPTLRAMYVLKATEAARVLAGETSEYINQEAELRGMTPRAMAETIDTMSRQSQELELQRMKLNIAIDAAGSEAAVVEALGAAGLELDQRIPGSVEMPLEGPLVTQ